MKLYKAKKEYIDELRKIDSKVMDNKDPKIRPYWFVAIDINGYQFAVPLTSPKDKHQVHYNRFTMARIKQGSDELGRLFFINMIPFHESLFVSVDDLKDSMDDKYENLLFKQQEALMKQQSQLQNKARNVFKARYDESHNLYLMLSRNACDFKRLINKMKEILNEAS